MDHCFKEWCSLFILEDHKEIISNKEADNVKHQDQVIRFGSSVNESHYISPYWKGQEWFFLILDAFYLNNENGKWKEYVYR